MKRAEMTMAVSCVERDGSMRLGMETRPRVEAKVRVDGDAGGNALRSLDDWLRHERIAGLRSEFRRAPTVPGEMGGELSSWLTLILPIASAGATAIATSHAFVQTVSTIQGWASRQGKQVTAELEIGGKTVKISGEGEDIKALIEKLSQNGTGMQV